MLEIVAVYSILLQLAELKSSFFSKSSIRILLILLHCYLLLSHHLQLACQYLLKVKSSAKDFSKSQLDDNLTVLGFIVSLKCFILDERSFYS